MATFIDTYKPETFLTCPYNPSHKFRKSRAVYHLLKCSKNPRNPSLLICPNNAKHHLHPHEYYEHLLNCSSHLYELKNIVGNERKFVIESNLLDSEREQSTFGENWDDDWSVFTVKAELCMSYQDEQKQLLFGKKYELPRLPREPIGINILEESEDVKSIKQISNDHPKLIGTQANARFVFGSINQSG